MPVCRFALAPGPDGPGDRLGRDELEIVRGELERATDEFRAADGSYAFPMACRLYWGASKAERSKRTGRAEHVPGTSGVLRH